MMTHHRIRRDYEAEGDRVGVLLIVLGLVLFILVLYTTGGDTP